MRRPICRQLIIGMGRPRRFGQHGAMGPGDCGGRRMAAKASHSRVRAGVPNPLAYATQGCADGLYALVERSDALTIRDLESMRARRADLDEIWRNGCVQLACAVGPSASHRPLPSPPRLRQRESTHYVIKLIFQHMTCKLVVTAIQKRAFLGGSSPAQKATPV